MGVGGAGDGDGGIVVSAVIGWVLLRTFEELVSKSRVLLKAPRQGFSPGEGGVRIRQSSSGSSPHPVITTSCIGVPSTPDDGSYAASIIVSVVKPRTSWPKTTCFPSSWGCGKVMIENCELLVFGPELAMLSSPGTGCEPGGGWGQS